MIALNIIQIEGEIRRNVTLSAKNNKKVCIKSMQKDHAWNHSTCAFECDKHCKIDEYLKDSISKKNDLVIACD